MRDTTAWAISIVSLSIFCIPIIIGIGYSRGWNVSLTTGLYEFETVYNSKRFWPEPNAYKENADIDANIPGRDWPSASSTWYYWKLRPAGVSFCQTEEFDPVTEPYVLSCDIPQSTASTKAFVWSCYLLHQVTIWAIIYKAQKLHRDDTHYNSQLRWYNGVSLLANALFYILHLIQTHTTYDATAQDVTEASSQASVIVLLVMVLLMEYKSRGLFLGWPASNDPAKICCCGRRDRNNSLSWRFPSSPTELVRKYHGYAFSWATIFTLWYHPMEATAAHVTGFLHTGILLIQQSLIFTPMHLNKYWRVTIEIFVAIHGSITAAQNRHMNGLFLFGFLWMFVFTQIHGLPYYLAFVEKTNEESLEHRTAEYDGEETDYQRNKISVLGRDPYLLTFRRFIPSSRWKRRFLRLVPPILYFIIVIVSYLTWLGADDQTLVGQIGGVIRIPIILYLLVVFVAIVCWGMLTASNATCIYCKESTNSKGAQEEVKDDGNEEEHLEDDNSSNEAMPASATDPSNKEDARKDVGSVGPGKVLATLFFCYGIVVAVSILFEAIHIQMNLTVQMVSLCAIISVCALFSMIVMEKDMRRIELGPPQLVGAIDEKGLAQLTNASTHADDV